MRGSRVLVGTDRAESLIGPGSVEKEPGVSSIGKYRWSIGIPLSEQPETKLSDVLDFPFEGLGELMLDAYVRHANLGIFQMIGDRADATAARRTGDTSRKQRRVGRIRERREDGWIRGRNGVESCTIKIQ